MPTNNSCDFQILPIANGGTNASSMATTDGVVYYDGTRLVTTSAGTAGQVLTSNGAGVAPTYQSSASSFLTQKTTLTSAQVKALHASPIQLVAAQGASTVIVPVSVAGKLVYGGSNAFSGTGTINLYYIDSSGTNALATQFMGSAAYAATVSKYVIDAGPTAGTSRDAGLIDNVALVVSYNSVTEISGNAANDNSIVIYLTYYIASLT